MRHVRRQAERLTPGPAAGWGWTRSSLIAGIVVLAVSAATAAAALWIRVADKQQQQGLFLRLIIISAVLAGVGFAAAALAKIADLRAVRARHDQNWHATVRSSLLKLPDGVLPRLSELDDAELGVTATRYTGADAPYVHRPVADARLAELLAASGPPYPFVVIVGSSKAGKSRTAARAMREVWGEQGPPVLLPRDGEALAALMRLQPPVPLTPPTAVWLDDLTAADLSHLNGEVLDAVARSGCLVTTMTAERWDEVKNGGEIATTALTALYRAQPVRLSFEMTEAETAEARRLYPDEVITASIAETLVGGPVLLDKYRAGRDQQPAGCAVVRAAVDARRCGLVRPLKRAELSRLFPLYLAGIRGDLEATPALFDEGLAWAARPVASQVALVTRNGDGWTILDYVVKADDGKNQHPSRPVLAQLWTELPDLAEPRDGVNIGIRAFLSGHLDAADPSWERPSTRRIRMHPWRP
jgi:hypothetical protein